MEKSDIIAKLSPLTNLFNRIKMKCHCDHGKFNRYHNIFWNISGIFMPTIPSELTSREQCMINISMAYHK